jgi:hypothetical protein
MQTQAMLNGQSYAFVPYADPPDGVIRRPPRSNLR